MSRNAFIASAFECPFTELLQVAVVPLMINSDIAISAFS